MFEDENVYTSNSIDDLTDEEFKQAPKDDVMREIDNLDTTYNNQLQEEYQQNPEPQNQQEVDQQEGQSNDIDPTVATEAYKFLMEPFKASGREFQLKDYHDARALMQQGIDYTRKQQQLKPRLIEMRTLENNGMLGNNLNYAIDLFQGKPEAIKKLIQDKHIDVSTLMPKQDEWGKPVEEEVNTNYVPTNHKISEAEYNAQELVNELSESPKYGDALKYLRTLDDNSVRKFWTEPNALKGLVHLMESGVHDDVMKELYYLRTINSDEVAGIDEYDAYTKVLQRMYGKQNQPQQEQYVQPQVQPQQQYMQQPYQQYQQVNPYVYQQQAVQQRKQSVSPIRNKGSVNRTIPDILSMPDEEFAKFNLNSIRML